MGSFCQIWLTGWSVPHFCLLIYRPPLHTIRDGVIVLAVFVAFLGPLADKVVFGNALLFNFPHDVLGVPFVLCLREVVFTDEKITHGAHRPFSGIAPLLPLPRSELGNGWQRN